MSDPRVHEMQRGLEKALRRAYLADDRELMGRVRDEGHRLVFLLNGLVRTSRLYSVENDALDQPAEDFATVLKGLLDLLGAVHLVTVEDQVFVNDVRLRVRPQEQVVVDAFAAELLRHEVGGLSFHAPLGTAAVKVLARALGAPAERPPRTALARRLQAVHDVEVFGRYRFRVSGERVSVVRSHDEVARQAAAVAREALAGLGSGRLPNPLPVRRAVVDMVDALPGHEDRAAAWPLRRASGNVGERHLVSVSHLALLLGRRLGLPEGALADLGVAAMLHDVGYVAGAGRSTHASAGLRLLSRQRGFHEGKLRRLRVVLEHHLPAYGPDEPPSIFARILRIADDYDVLTAPRPEQPGLPPPMAQASMWAARGSTYDSDLLALFVQALGLYPPGSLLELSDGRWVVSVSGGRDEARFAWPVARVVRRSDGSPCSGEESLDLAATRDLLRPRRVLNPATLGLDVGAALSAAFG
ncbi:MAG TPA: HD domain-containing protein [Vicinamibacteria bacterium]|nr:HD domain-containing protein [Vicinamibacteria bacterium]